MFHYFQWELKKNGKKTLLINKDWWIQVYYVGKKLAWEFFLYPYMDDNKKTILYYAFDSWEQQAVFEDLLKISGVWPKTAFQIAQLPKENVEKAIKTFDVKFFQAIPGIGPKSAKKILLELKDSFNVEDMQRLDLDQKLYKDIVKSLKWFWYDADRIKSVLQQYEWTIKKENMAEVIKWIISQM